MTNLTRLEDQRPRVLVIERCYVGYFRMGSNNAPMEFVGHVWHCRVCEQQRHIVAKEMQAGIKKWCRSCRPARPLLLELLKERGSGSGQPRRRDETFRRRSLSRRPSCRGAAGTSGTGAVGAASLRCCTSKRLFAEHPLASKLAARPRQTVHVELLNLKT